MPCLCHIQSNGLWSVRTKVGDPSTQTLKVSRAQTTAKALISVMLHFSFVRAQHTPREGDKALSSPAVLLRKSSI